MRKVAEFLVNYRKAIAALVLVIFCFSVISILFVTVNKDMTRYLPESLQVKQGMDIMNDEFGESTDLRIMVKNIPEDKRQALADDVSDLSFVTSASYEEDNALYNNGSDAYYDVVVKGNSYATETQKENDAVNSIIASRGYEYTNATVLGDGTSDLGPVFAAAIIIAMIILFVLATSWIEPVLMLLTIVVAVGINMGTNVFLPSVSNTTFTIAAILQMALSMDYLIMLMNRYRTERQTKDAESAMTRALEKGVTAIASSSVTTVVGLLCLCFMSFTIGMDMGFVLAKGVFISLICVFTFQPALAIAADRIMWQTQKPYLHPTLKGLAGFSYKFRVVILIAFVAIFVFGFTMRDKVSIDFLGDDAPTEAQTEVDAKFPPMQQLVVVCDNEKRDEVWKVVEQFAQRDDVRSLNAYENLLGEEKTASELADSYDYDAPFMKMIFYYNKHGGTLGSIDKSAFANYLRNDVKTDLGSAMDDSELSNISSLATYVDNVATGTYSADQLCTAIDKYSVDENTLRLLYLSYLAHYNYNDSWTMNADELTDYLANTLTHDSTFGSFFTTETKKSLTEARDKVEEGISLLRGPEHSRYTMQVPYTADSSEMDAMVTDLKTVLAEKVGSGYYLVGEGPMVQDMSASFNSEFSFISLITAIAIFLIVLITFRNVAVPLMLVALIQGAFCWDMALNYALGHSIYYIALLIVQSILMGAAIDYAILFTSNYRESRESMNVRDALQDSYQRSFRTVAMSGGILVMVTGIIGLVAPGMTGMICLIIAEGALLSVILVTFILPGSLATLDKIVVPKKRRFESMQS